MTMYYYNPLVIKECIFWKMSINGYTFNKLEKTQSGWACIKWTPFLSENWVYNIYVNII